MITATKIHKKVNEDYEKYREGLITKTEFMVTYYDMCKTYLLERKTKLEQEGNLIAATILQD